MHKYALTMYFDTIEELQAWSRTKPTQESPKAATPVEKPAGDPAEAVRDGLKKFGNKQMAAWLQERYEASKIKDLDEQQLSDFTAFVTEQIANA